MPISHYLIPKGTPLIRPNDLAISSRTRSSVAQFCYGTIATGSYSSGDTVIFAELPVSRIIRIHMISFDTTPISKFWGPGSFTAVNNAFPLLTFTTTAQNGIGVDFIIEYNGDQSSGKSGFLPQVKII